MQQRAQRVVETSRKTLGLENNMAIGTMPKLVSLEDWAKRMFGDRKPHRNTLRNWRKQGLINPLPVKCGRSYFVEPDAVYMDEGGELARRIGNGR